MELFRPLYNVLLSPTILTMSVISLLRQKQTFRLFLLLADRKNFHFRRRLLLVLLSHFQPLRIVILIDEIRDIRSGEYSQRGQIELAV